MPSFAVWEMCDAFERGWGSEGEGESQLHQYHVMAAAQWILWDGQEIFQHMANPLPVSDLAKKMWQLGDCCTPSSMPAVSLARWQFWKERFKAAGAEGGDGSVESKDLAGRAAALMDVIEKSMSF